MQRLGLNAIAELLVEGRHPELNNHRKHQDCHQGKRELDRFGVDDALNRGLHQLNANQQHERRHDQTREILVAAMSVRMLGVGRLARQLKAKHAHDVRADIGQVVHGVRHNRNRSRQHANCTLRSAKRNIGENTHYARQRSHARTVALRTTNNPLDHPHQSPRYYLYIYCSNGL